ncbi:ribonuclease H-like domain-containing protein [Tanacetum coccineum]
MEFESAHSNTTAKLPILKLGEYEMWVIRIKQYFQVQDYALWEVIENGNSWVSVPQTTQENGTSVTKMPVPYTDAKTMFAAIETRFGRLIEQSVKKSVGCQEVVSKPWHVMTACSKLLAVHMCYTAKHAYEVRQIPWMIDLEAMDLKVVALSAMFEGKDWYLSSGRQEKFSLMLMIMLWYDKSKVKWFQLYKRGHFAKNVETKEQSGSVQIQDNIGSKEKRRHLFKAMLDIDGLVLKRDVACKDYEINVLKTSTKRPRQLLGMSDPDKSKKVLGYNVVPPPHPLIYNRPKKLDLSYYGLDEFKEPEFKAYGSKDKQVSKDSSSFVESSLNVDKENIFPVDKKVEFVKPKNHDKPVKKSVRLIANTIKGKGWYMGIIITSTINCKKALSTKNSINQQKVFYQNKVNIAQGYIALICKAKEVKTARPNSAVVNAVRVNQANAGKPQQDDTRFVDSGCSRHMTRNIAYSRISREKGIRREYSVAKTPQQNGVAKRRNKTLIEAARTMLADSKLPTTFWAEAVSTACYVQNRVLVVKPHNKTPYKLFRGFKPALSFMRPFRWHVIILNTLG